MKHTIFLISDWVEKQTNKKNKTVYFQKISSAYLYENHLYYDVVIEQ
jgi:hypothetical protein